MQLWLTVASFATIDAFVLKRSSLVIPGFLGKLTAFEEDLLKASLPELLGSIKKGVEFVEKNC